jgi:acyl carrier protein
VTAPLIQKRKNMTSRDDIKERLNDVFRDVFDDDSIQIRGEMTADDLEEWDSLRHITLVLAVEREFDIRLKAAEVGDLANVGAMLQLIKDRRRS